MITDHTGEVTFEAIDSKEVKKRQQAAQNAYVKAGKAWRKASKNDPSAVKPTKPTFRVLESKVTGTDAKQKAEESAARWKERYEKKQAEKERAEAGGESKK